ncbi:hypothetical protein ACJZ2D_016227 [Fusarium nematophilum]
MSGLSIDEAKTRIQHDGFCVIENPDLGSRFEEMREKEYSFSFSEHTGFNFCRDFVLSNPYIRGILDALGSDENSRYILAYCGGFSPDPQRTYSLRDGGQKPLILVVQAWPKSPSSIYYYASHKCKITRVRGATGFYEVPPAEIKDKGLHGKDLDMEQGGM